MTRYAAFRTPSPSHRTLDVRRPTVRSARMHSARPPLNTIDRAIQSAVNMVGDDLPNWIQWLRETGLGDVLLFSSSMAMLVYAADTPPKLRGINATIFRLVFGSGEPTNDFSCIPAALTIALCLGTRMVSSDSIRSRQTTPLPSPPPEWEDDDDWDDGFGPSSPGPTSPDDSRSRFALEPVTETEREQ